MGEVSAWSTRAASSFAPSKFSPVILKPARWPGAATIAYGDKFANIYVGTGLREEGGEVVPPSAPKRLGEVQKEWSFALQGDEAAVEAEKIAEQADPTPEAEAAYEEERRAKEKGEGGEGGEEGAEGEEGEEEDA
jgi:hypothetical protein